MAPLSARIAAIHPDLEWEMGKGHRARHHLCVSSKGDPQLRVIAERWRSAGPGDSEDFEFHCSRQRVAGLASDVSMRFGELELSFSELRFAVELDALRQRFHVVGYHEVFGQVEERLRVQMLFIALDNIVGEDAVETWLGSIRPGEGDAPDDAVGPDVLRRLVDDAPQRWPEREWAIFEGTHPDTGARMVLTACASHKYLLNPLFDTLCRIRLPYEPLHEGMPGEADREWLDTFDDGLEDLGDAVLSLARETGNGARTHFIYLRAENGPERRALEDLTARFEGGSMQISWDPGWRSLPV